MKENWRMSSTCNRSDLQTLGSQPISMPKTLPDHWRRFVCNESPEGGSNTTSYDDHRRSSKKPISISLGKFDDLKILSGRSRRNPSICYWIACRKLVLLVAKTNPQNNKRKPPQKFLDLVDKTMKEEWRHQGLNLVFGNTVREEPVVSCRWTGWVWEITGWSWRLQENC